MSAHADLSSFFSPNVPFRWLNGGTVLLSCLVAVLLSRVRNEIMQKDVATDERGSYIEACYILNALLALFVGRGKTCARKRAAVEFRADETSSKR